MVEEYFDIVDENNLPTGGTVLRSEAHQEGTWHRAVHIYVYRKIGDTLQILVHLRSKDKDLQPNTWTAAFGGHIKSGSTPEKSTLEELHEEIGLVPDSEKLKFIEIYKYDGTTNREFCYTSFYEFEGDMSELHFNDGEVQSVKWMTLDEICVEIIENPKRWIHSNEDIVSLKNLFEKHSS